MENLGTAAILDFQVGALQPYGTVLNQQMKFLKISGWVIGWNYTKFGVIRGPSEMLQSL